MTSIRVDAEEIESTRGERLLAVALAAFVLIGAGWAYVRVDGAVSRGTAQPTASEQRAFDALSAAQGRLFEAQAGERQALQRLELAREAYRTALDAGRRAPELERAYERAQDGYGEARARSRQAAAAVADARPAADAAGRAYGPRAAAARHRHDLLVAGLRLALVVALLLAGYRLLAVLRRRGTRWLPLAFSVVGAAVVLALVLACDYVTGYVDPLELGPLVLSLVGAAATVAAFAGLQRWLARRVPMRRVRRGECPFCGYPARAGGRHCEGCGRDVVAACTSCGGERRVGTAHCVTCGAG